MKIARIKTFFIPLTVMLMDKLRICSSSITLQNNELGTSRNLSLNCPPGNFNSITNDLGSTHKLSTYSRGDVGIQMIKRIRGNQSSLYQSVLDNIIMSSCNVETKKERCVPSHSSEAAKNWNNSCIIASDYTCDEGMCERVSNCYWNTVVEGENRTTRFPPENYAKSKDLLWGYGGESYLRGVLMFGAIGIFISIILLLLWIIFFIGRHCCCCLWTSCGICFLCSPIPNEHGYKVCCQWIMPSIVFFLISSVLALSGASAFIGNEDISVATTNSFIYTSSLIEDLREFLDRSRQPLDNVEGIVEGAAVDAKYIFNDTYYVKATANQIITSFSDFGDLHLQGLQSSNAKSSFDSALEMFNDKVTPIVDRIQLMLDTLEVDLYNNVDNIQSALGSAIDQINSFSNQTLFWQEDTTKYESQEYSFRTYRKFGVMGIFLLSVTVSSMGLIGILTSRSSKCGGLFRLLNVAGILSALLGSVAFFLASVTLSSSILWYDICEMSNIVTSNDFEPFLGDRIAPAANACFNDTNLAVAFNITDKVNFQAKLDEGLDVIKQVNITEQFQKVVSPLQKIQDAFDTISDTALDVFNYGTNVNTPLCPFDDVYTKDTIREPWIANRGDVYTSWTLMESGKLGTYARKGDENGTQYIARIYDAAGTCARSESCCLNNLCSQSVNLPCNSGIDCVNVCSEFVNMIQRAYDGLLLAFDTEQMMTADLGVRCPVNHDDNFSCPTLAFQEKGNNKTLVSLIESYRDNITETADSLVSIATTSVGETMDEVEDFLCNMNISFVATRYEQVRENVCTSMFGGFAQVNWALWILGICLEFIAVLSNILSTRLRGVSRSEALLQFQSYSSKKGFTHAQLYG